MPNVFIVVRQRGDLHVALIPTYTALPCLKLRTSSLFSTILSTATVRLWALKRITQSGRSQLPEYLSRRQPPTRDGRNVCLVSGILSTNTGHGPGVPAALPTKVPSHPPVNNHKWQRLPPPPSSPAPVTERTPPNPLPTDYARLPPSVLMSWANDRQVDPVEKDTARAVQVPSTAIPSPADSLWYLR